MGAWIVKGKKNKKLIRVRQEDFYWENKKHTLPESEDLKFIFEGSHEKTL
ncbi:MAG: hypothetical protein WC373_00715 [Smithella sp.]|jgi:hypothetical protein